MHTPDVGDVRCLGLDTVMDRPFFLLLGSCFFSTFRSSANTKTFYEYSYCCCTRAGYRLYLENHTCKMAPPGSHQPSRRWRLQALVQLLVSYVLDRTNKPNFTPTQRYTTPT